MHFKTLTADKLLWLAAWALLAFLATSQLSLAWVRSPSGDDAMFLSVPKNWLNGYGWATSYSEKIPFNPDFTGPTSLLLLTAPLIALFGPEPWIGGVVGASVNLLLVLLCWQQFRQYWRNSGLAAFALAAGCLASMPTDFASLVGYYTGSLLFLLGCCIACNPHATPARKGLALGSLAAAGLLTKWLLLPAFVLLLVATGWQTPRGERRRFALATLLPLVLVLGSWHGYQRQVLSGYSDAFLAARADYGRAFFLYHGSGIGQWQDAPDKWDHLWRNIDRNLYFVEESLALHGLRNPWLGDAPADEHHVLGIALLLLLAGLFAWHGRRWLQGHPAPPLTTFRCLLLATILAYFGWFLVLAMAMSPGHLFFPAQWTLWLLLLAVSQWPARQHGLLQGLTAAGMLCAGTLVFMTDEGRAVVLRFERDNVLRPAALQEAAAVLRDGQLPQPLAGCGYAGYPRHLEYLLPGSGNFADCLDLIEDHVEQDADGHYRWRSPLAFTLVFSLQTAGFNSATGPVLQACSRRVLYRNDDVIISRCTMEDLQALALDPLMAEIRKHQGWYRTRLAANGAIFK